MPCRIISVKLRLRARPVRLSWPCSLNSKWNNSASSEPEKGREEMRTRGLVFTLCVLAFATEASAKNGLTSADLRQLRNADDVQISPGGKLIAYTIVNRDRPG